MFLRDENIVVNIIDDLAPRCVPVLKRIALAARGRGSRRHGLAGLVIAARDTFEFNDVTADLGLSRVLHWIALLVGVIGAAVAALAMAIARGNERR